MATDELETALVLEEAPHGFWCEHQEDEKDCPQRATVALLAVSPDTATTRHYACSPDHAGERAIILLMDGIDVQFKD